jgi:hypothetical protein
MFEGRKGPGIAVAGIWVGILTLGCGASAANDDDESVASQQLDRW